MSSLLHVSFVPFIIIYRTFAPLHVHRGNHRQYSTIYGAVTGEVCTSVLFHCYLYSFCKLNSHSDFSPACIIWSSSIVLTTNVYSPADAACILDRKLVLYHHTCTLGWYFMHRMLLDLKVPCSHGNTNFGVRNMSMWGVMEIRTVVTPSCKDWECWESEHYKHLLFHELSNECCIPAQVLCTLKASYNPNWNAEISFIHDVETRGETRIISGNVVLNLVGT